MDENDPIAVRLNTLKELIKKELEAAAIKTADKPSTSKESPETKKELTAESSASDSKFKRWKLKRGGTSQE